MHNFMDPAILFFLLGLLAATCKSNLEIPPQISRFLSLYLLMAVGLKGGFALAASGADGAVVVSLACAVLLAVSLPLIGYRVLRRFVPRFDAAALAASYGSVSAVTFITTTQFLDAGQIAYGGHMAAAMALMESPAILIAVVLANRLRRTAQDGVAMSGGAAVLGKRGGSSSGASIGKILHESLTDGAQLVLLGSLAVGILTGAAGEAAMQPFSGGLFKGMLALFLLDMGLLAARSLPGLKGSSPWLLAYGVIAPLAHATVALALAGLFHFSVGNAVLLMVLAASASYIAVPAAVRLAIPEANPSLYIGMALAVTFPLNVLLGIPLYAEVAARVLS
jgi:uncharacterized protein